MKPTASKTLFTIAGLSVLILVFSIFVSCSASKKQKAVGNLSDTLRSNYTAELSFVLTSDSDSFDGNATVTKSNDITRLDIHSPDPFSGLSIEYDVKGLPDSVALHFSGMNASLPDKAIAKINSVASLFADSLPTEISAIPSESITEYELPDKKGCCVKILRSDAEITLYFSVDGTIPYSIEYASENLRAEITFDSFLPSAAENDANNPPKA